MVSTNLVISALLPLVFGLVSIGAGVFFLVMAMRSRQLVGPAQQWQAVPARVIRTAVEQRPGPNGRTFYEPVVEYEYSVLDAPYRGQRVALGETRYTRAQAEALVARYPSGSSSTVYYNPGSPAEAVLVREAPNAVLWLALGILFLLLGLGICCIGSVFGLFLPAFQGPVTAP